MSQRSHLNGFFPSWTSELCFLTADCLEKFWLHKSHSKSFFVSWTSVICFSIFWSLLNKLFHFENHIQLILVLRYDIYFNNNQLLTMVTRYLWFDVHSRKIVRLLNSEQVSNVWPQSHVFQIIIVVYFNSWILGIVWLNIGQSYS